jgi:dolichol-phosphate mannosyltransferase
VPRLVSEAQLQDADVVVASRHVEGGSSAGLANMVRVAVSRVAILLAKLFFPGRLRGVSDPMSGYFLVRTAAIDVDVLRPQGFKILLEIMARTPSLTRHEVPFSFGERLCGESKASVREGGRFLRQLARLEADRVRGAQQTRTRSGVLNRGALYGAIGMTGLAVNTLLMWLLVEGSAGMTYLVAAVVATQVSTTWNFVLVDSLVYRGAKRLTWLHRWLGVMALSNVVLVLRVPLLALLVTGLGVHYLLANVITLVLGFLVRFSGQERLSLVKESP